MYLREVGVREHTEFIFRAVVSSAGGFHLSPEMRRCRTTSSGPSALEVDFCPYSLRAGGLQVAYIRMPVAYIKTPVVISCQLIDIQMLTTSNW